MSARFRIVSLCGSAGALKGYMEFLRQMPIDSGMSFVILTHRRKDTPSLLVEILSTVTAMHVEEIVNGTRFEPNMVYVIPAGQDLTMDGTAFCLVPMTTTAGWPNGFDIYLKSVAASTSARAVTVILSGLGFDGSALLGALRHSGGVNYAQSGASESSMPRSAVRTGMIDYSGSPGEIASAVLNRSFLGEPLLP
jgi:chemotaxis response regulator CheB